MPFAIRNDSTVLFIGDSITDCGRRNESAPLGIGYVSQVHDLIRARYPSRRVTVINKGIGGNTVVDLADRWTDDAIRHQPNLLSVKIGINDLHRWFRGETDVDTSPAEFRRLYDHILSRVRKETRAKLILVDPFYISNDRDAHSFRARVLQELPKYISVVHAMASKYRTRLVRTHDAFQKVIAHHEPDTLCPEPVHPNAAGHLVIAHEWLKQMDF
ncbi:MAG: GDSL family lipase [Phycisphaeraceae bacterium]|nr:GDSL family lipase [Phycisphaeraceae bacterium]